LDVSPVIVRKKKYEIHNEPKPLAEIFIIPLIPQLKGVV
jgi:hypothetical protein